jgi:hypothetical protein
MSMGVYCVWQEKADFYYKQRHLMARWAFHRQELSASMTRENMDGPNLSIKVKLTY